MVLPAAAKTAASSVARDQEIAMLITMATIVSGLEDKGEEKIGTYG
jgi:hypothetical protein